MFSWWQHDKALQVQYQKLFHCCVMEVLIVNKTLQLLQHRTGEMETNGISGLDILHSKKEILKHPVKPCSTELFSFSCASCRGFIPWNNTKMNALLFRQSFPPWKITTVRCLVELNLFPQYFPCWNKLAQFQTIPWFTQENTMAA